jgi:hypothetical protein
MVTRNSRPRIHQRRFGILLRENPRMGGRVTVLIKVGILVIEIE